MSEGSTARVLVLTPDSNAPIGGVKIHYQLVDALNRAGVDARVVHRKRGFRCTWFQNTTQVESLDTLRVSGHDLLVLPEEWMAFIPDLPADVPKVIFHQNAYTTFSWGADPDVIRNVLHRPDVKRVVVVSDDNAAYLRYAFPDVDIQRIRYTIDQSIFSTSPNVHKRRQIAYMPRRRAQESVDVLSLLRSRGVLDGWPIVAIDNMTEAQVADHLRHSAIFLSFSEREGLPLPPAEAMACGCVVIGFHGFGGRDFADNAIWVSEGDVVEFARTVESVLKTWQQDADRFRLLTERASAHIRDTYNAANTERDVLTAFGFSTANVPVGGSYALSDSMWQALPLGRRMIRRATRAFGVLLRG